MNFFQLILKQMRQRALSTWLTLLSVMLGVGLAVSIMVFQREGEKLFGQSDFGYDLIIGAKGSPLQLVLNTVYHIDQSPGNIPYKLYQELGKPRHLMVRSALPIAVGDEYKGFRVVGTLAHVFPVNFEGKLLARESLLENLATAAQEADKNWPERDEVMRSEEMEDVDPRYKQLLPYTRDKERLEEAATEIRSDHFRVFQYRHNRHLELEQGRAFHPEKFEAVLGVEVARQTGLKIGDQFKVAHGVGGDGDAEDEHDEKWTVVGILGETRTSSDKIIYVPLISFYAIPKHDEYQKVLERFRQLQQQQAGGGRSAAAPPATAPAKEEADHDHDDDHKPATLPAPPRAAAHDDHDHDQPATKPAATQPAAHAHAGEGAHDDHDHPYHLHDDGTIHLHSMPDQWNLSAILVRTRSVFHQMNLKWRFDNGTEAAAVNPVTVMSEFYRTFLKGSSSLLLGIALLVTIVAAVSILVSIYNSVSARLKEIAILRALGATRFRILALICVEAGIIGIVGGIGGLLLGHLLAAAGSAFLQRLLGEGIDWLAISRWEWIYLGVVAILAVLAGLVPALKAYRSPVATNLVAA